jgi:RHS repeat-associated protein
MISRLTSISDPSGTLEAYTYLGLDTIVRRSHPQSGLTLTYIGTGIGDAGDQYTGLDRFGRIEDQKWVNTSGDAVDEYRYGYDRDGNVLWKENVLNAACSEVYTYDLLNRLTSYQRGTLNTTKTGIDGTPSASQSWNLDALGNSASVTTDGVEEERQHNAQNELTQLGEATQSFDPNGNTTTDQTGKTFVYDAWNHQVAVLDGETTLQAYAFDALGRRIQEVASGIYFSAAGQRIEVRANGQVSEQETWSPVYVNCMIERDRDTNADGALDERLWPAQDAIYNVTGVVNSSGQVLRRFVNAPYGSRLTLDAACQPTTDIYSFSQGFQGGFADPVSGLIHFGARDYDIGTMRWLQQDPDGYVDGMSLYAYANGNTLQFVDPFGLARESASGPHDLNDGDDQTGPWETGWEWLTGTGPSHHTFTQNSYFTLQLRKSSHIRETVADVSKRLGAQCANCDSSAFGGANDNSLAGLQGIPIYIRDYSVIPTFGLTGNIAATYLGSYTLDYTVDSVDCQSGTATVHIHVFNPSSLGSALRLPYIGYMSGWRVVSGVLNHNSGPMSTTTQDFYWDEQVTFGGNKDCKCPTTKPSSGGQQ